MRRDDAPPPLPEWEETEKWRSAWRRAQSYVNLRQEWPASVVSGSVADIFFMALQEIQTSPRPLTHRPSMSNVANGAGSLSSSASNGLANRLPHSRNGSHSIIGAALNSGHRVSRRKSMTSPGATNVAAMAAIIQEADVLPNGGLAINARRNTLSKTGGSAVSSSLGGFPRGTSAMAAALATAGTNGLIGSLPLPSPPASLPSRKFVTADGSAIDDDLNDMSDGEIDPASLADANAIAFEIARVRRASDGQPLLKEGRRSSRMELRCKKCGKGYKHSSCLTKHLYVLTLLDDHQFC